MTTAPIPLAELRQILRYEGSGLVWTNGRRAGESAMSIDRRGYGRVKLKGQFVAAHRIVWALCVGEWPQQAIDHRNGDPADNRIENLRLCTPSQNAANSKPKNGGRFKGVCALPNGRFQVTAARRYVGRFDSEEEAARAYDAAARAAHGEFARTNFRSA